MASLALDGAYLHGHALWVCVFDFRGRRTDSSFNSSTHKHTHMCMYIDVEGTSNNECVNEIHPRIEYVWETTKRIVRIFPSKATKQFVVGRWHAVHSMRICRLSHILHTVMLHNMAMVHLNCCEWLDYMCQSSAHRIVGRCAHHTNDVVCASVSLCDVMFSRCVVVVGKTNNGHTHIPYWIRVKTQEHTSTRTAISITGTKKRSV